MTTGRHPPPDTALVDANVFYSQHHRNVLMTLATERLVTLRWTEEIEREWCNALIRNRPGLTVERLRRTVDKMNEALPDAKIRDYGHFVALLSKTNPKDRHVAAAAIKCSPATVITWNVRDFDAEELAARGVTTSNPDELLCRIFDKEPVDAYAATIRAYSFLKKQNAHPGWAEYIAILDNQRLHGFAARLRQRLSVRHRERIS